MTASAAMTSRPHIRATGRVNAPRPAVFAFLRDLDNHWLLTDRFIDAERLDGDGGRVRMRGPLGLTRVASTSVDHATPPSRIAGTATVGVRTRAVVSWRLDQAAGGGTTVDLEAAV